MCPGEEYGLTHDDHRLIMSDGSSKSRFLDPETSVEMGRLKVFDGTSVNELEFVEGKMYADKSLCIPY